MSGRGISGIIWRQQLWPTHKCIGLLAIFQVFATRTGWSDPRFSSFFSSTTFFFPSPMRSSSEEFGRRRFMLIFQISIACNFFLATFALLSSYSSGSSFYGLFFYRNVYASFNFLISVLITFCCLPFKTYITWLTVSSAIDLYRNPCVFRCLISSFTHLWSCGSLSTLLDSII